MPPRKNQQQQQQQQQAPAAPAAPKPKSKRTKGWQFDVTANGQTDPAAVFRAVAKDPEVQYLAHTVDPVSGNLKGVVQFKRPKTSKAFESAHWQTVGARSAPLRVTSSTAPSLLGNRIWAYGSLTAERAPRQAAPGVQQQRQQEYEHGGDDDEDEYD